MHTILIRLTVGIIFGILSSGVIFLSRYGDMVKLTGAIFSGILLSLSVFFLVGGNLKELKSNRDRKGKVHSWKSTLTGIFIFIVSIPFVIWFTLYLFGYLGN